MSEHRTGCHAAGLPLDGPDYPPCDCGKDLFDTPLSDITDAEWDAFNRAINPPTLTIELSGLPDSPNATRREHWATKGKNAAQWRRDAAILALDAANKAKWLTPDTCTIGVVGLFKDHKRHDPDNLLAAIKPCLDGIVDAGVIADDSFSVIRRLTVSCEVGTRVGIRVVVTALPEA